MKLRCDDQPLLEHVEQLLAELGGEVEGNEGNPEVDEEFEPRSDEDEDDADAPMEHWWQSLACIFKISPHPFMPSIL